MAKRSVKKKAKPAKRRPDAHTRKTPRKAAAQTKDRKLGTAKPKQTAKRVAKANAKKDTEAKAKRAAKATAKKEAEARKKRALDAIAPIAAEGDQTSADGAGIDAPNAISEQAARPATSSK